MHTALTGSYPIHLCAPLSSSPLPWLNSNSPPPGPYTKSSLETGCQFVWHFRKWRWVQGHFTKAFHLFWIVIRRCASPSLFFLHRDSIPNSAIPRQGGPQLLPVDRSNSVGWCDVPLTCPLGHEGNALRRAQCLVRRMLPKSGIFYTATQLLILPITQRPPSSNNEHYSFTLSAVLE